MMMISIRFVTANSWAESASKINAYLIHDTFAAKV
jgi:hypothetical protein